MKIFTVNLTTIFILLLIAYVPSSAQTCNVTISGAHCVGDTLTAHFTGGTASDLVWLLDSYPIYHPNEQTAAGKGTGSADSLLNNPTGVCVDKKGNVYVADAGNNRIQKWVPGATKGVTVAGGNGEGDAANQLSSPEGVFVDAAGNIYVADTHNWRIQKWAPGATSGVTVAGGNGFGSDANQLYYPTSVFVVAGNIYIADLENDRIQKWAPGATSGITVAGGNGNGSAANQLAYPKSTYVDAQKNIYIADWFNHRIQKWKNGADSGTTVAGGNGAGYAANQLNYPTGVYVDTSGNIFIADNYNHRIQKWAPGAATGSTIDIGALVNPTGLFIDSKNNIYVTDPFFNVVSEYLSHVIDYNYPTDGNYVGNIRAVATSANGCIDTSNSIKIFIPAKISGIIGKTTDLCGGGNFQYSAQFNFFGQSGIYDTTGIVINWVVPKGCTILWAREQLQSN